MKPNPLDDLDAADIEKMLVVLNGGQPEGVDAEEAAAVRDAFKKAPLLAIVVIRAISRSAVPDELAAYARRMYDAYTEAGLPENIVAGLVTSAVNAMSVKAGMAVGGG